MENLKTRLLITGCSAAILTLSFGCSKNSPLNPLGCGNTAWTTQVSAEATAYNNALAAYSDDPTPENCDDFKTATKNYLDALEDAVKCVPTANRAQIDQEIDEAKADIDNSDCD